MLSIPVPPKITSTMKMKRSAETITAERRQNGKLQELGIDPYEYDIDVDYSEKEQKVINEVMKLIALDKEVPEELAKLVKQITASRQSI